RGSARAAAPPEGLVNRLRFDPAGRRLLAIGDGLNVWETDSGRAVAGPPDAIPPGTQHPGAWFGPEGASLVVATGDAATVWPLAGGGPPVRLAAANLGPPRSAAVSAD